MKFMTLVKGSENAGMPPQALFDAIDAHMAEQAKAGVLIDAGGLAPTSQGARVRITGGTVSTTDGPFTEAKEVIGGYAILNAASREDVVRMVQELMDMHVRLWPGWEGECEVRQLAG